MKCKDTVLIYFCPKYNRKPNDLSHIYPLYDAIKKICKKDKKISSINFHTIHNEPDTNILMIDCDK